MPSQRALKKAAAFLPTIGLLLFLLFFAQVPSPAAKVLDGFLINDTGLVTITGEGVRVVAVQPWDGKILIGGNFTITGSSELFDYDWWEWQRSTVATLHNLARINNDGTLDATFAPEPDAPVNAIVIEQDRTDPTKAGQSRIYIGGEFKEAAGLPRNGLARLEAGNGTADPDFAPATAAETVVKALLLQGTRMVVGGSFGELDGTSCNNLAALSIAAGSDGELVQAFSGGTDGAVNALLLQDGYLVVGGDFNTPRKFLARFDPDDLLDNAFTPQPSRQVRSLALQADGMILAGGDFTSVTRELDPLSPQSRNYLVRLTSDGKLTPFDPLLEPFPLAAENYVSSLALQPDGKILAGGKFQRETAQVDKPNRNLARFNPDGTPDASVDTGLGAGTDDAIDSIALEPNGRFLIGGKFGQAGGKTQTRLARFYFHGGLDDDGEVLSPALRRAIYNISLRPDGTFTVAGVTPSPLGIGTTVRKLRPDFTHDPSYGEGLLLDYSVFVQSLMPDNKLFIGGYFLKPQKMLAQLDENGEMTGFQSAFLQGLPELEYSDSGVDQVLLVPKAFPASRPAGATLPEGTMYVAGHYLPKGASKDQIVAFLKRMDPSGNVDPSFTPPSFDGPVYSIALQEDGKLLLAGKFTGNLMRLHSDGEQDTGFRPWSPPNEPWTAYYVVVVQPDGKILAAGSFNEVVSPDNPLVTKPHGAIVRLNSDGSVDDTFNGAPIHLHYPGSLKNLSLLTDGSMIITGFFDRVIDENGTHFRGGVARLSKEGRVLGPNFFTIDSITGMSIANSQVQPDGKSVICGSFDADDDIFRTPLERYPTAKYITRVSSPDWATQELAVAPDGSAVTWMRGGSGPEVWSVWFEEKSEAPGDTWKYLGRGKRIDGGWTIERQSLPKKENRFVRARGYAGTFGYDSGNSQIVESVRRYYLKEPVRVRAQAESRVYGGANPPSYTATYLDAEGKPKLLAPGTFHGMPTFASPATAASGAGDYPIIADVSGMSSPVYAFIPENGTLSVTKKTLTVRALDATSVPGVGNRTFTAGYSGFVGSDTKENSVAGEPELTTIATAQSPPGEYVITAALGTLRSSNYQFAFQNGTLTIEGRLSQTIAFQAPPAVTYGDPGVPIVASSNRGLQLAYESSLPSVAVVENGVIVPKRAGTTLITARQGGNLLYEAATPVSHPFTVRKKELKVSAEPKARAYRTPNPTLTVSYQGFVNGENSSVISGTPLLSSAASLDSSVGSYPIVVGLGTLRADNYFLTPVNGTLTVLNSCQEIIFPPIGERTYGDPPLQITAIACSGLSLSFASSQTAVATVSGNLLTITGAGTTVITASQRGNGDIDPARPVSQSLVVHKRGQSISFGALPPKLLGDAPVTLEAAASSGLPVSYLSSVPAVAAVSGSTLTIAGAGTTVITARQEGDRNYEASLPASQPFTVALEVEPPLLRLSTLPSGSVTASPVLNVSGSARDASGIASLTVNSADLTGAASLFSSAVPLDVGENSITVTAKDGAGNVARESVSVTLDAAAPFLAVTEPADNSATDVSLFTARGSVPAGSAVTMAVNGAAPQAVAVSSGTFNGTGYLRTGINTVELAAELSGRVARAKRTVTLNEGAPPVAITEPGEDLRTEENAIVIKGRGGNGEIGGAILEVNGVPHPVAVEGGAFQQQVELAQTGEYRIKVTVTDGAARSSSARRNVIRVGRIAGDLDRNGVVDIGDAVALLRISLGIDPAGEEAIARGDLAPVIDGVPRPDGTIGIGDVLILLRKIVGLIE